MSPQSFFGFGNRPYSEYFPESSPALAPTDPYAAAAGYDTTLKDRAFDAGQLQATQENFDPNDPESVSGLERLIAMGKVKPSVGRALIPKTTGKYGILSPEHAATAAEISTIPWNADDAEQQVRAAIQKNPNFAATPQGQSWLTAFQQHRKAVAPNPTKDLEYQMAASGVDPDTFDHYRDPNTGKIDPRKAAYAMFQAKSGAKSMLPPTIKQRQQIVDAFAGIHNEPTDQEALDAYNEAHSTSLSPGSWFSKPAPQQIEEGRHLAKQARVKGLVNTLAALQESGVRLPDAIQQHLDNGDIVPPSQPAMAPPVAVPQVTPPVQQQIPSFNTMDEAEASNVPVGSVVIIGGRKFLKK